jgi:hypothetical protein
MTRAKPIKDISTTCQKQQELIQQIVNPSISARYNQKIFLFLDFKYVVGELRRELHSFPFADFRSKGKVSSKSSIKRE